MEHSATSFHDIGTTTDWVVMAVYFIGIMVFGSYFGRYTKSTSDFFFGGRRFDWWLITMSIVATGIGSHSFIKYSAKGFEHGLSSSITYLNDWFLIPFFMFGWLPIIVYSRVRSIPEYFEKRFAPSARFIATILLLVYMIGYIGIGFLTLGKAMLPLLPETFGLLGLMVPVTLMGVIIVIAVITGVYITFGGQTAVIFTDLLQGFILLFAGFMVFFFGLSYLGGLEIFWDLLPTAWKLPLPDFNRDPSFNFAGIFWQDGIAGSIGFLFMNQGLLMRFMACRSVQDGRKAAATNILVIMPLSAVVVGGAGWIGKAISVAQPAVVSPATPPDQIFVVVANIIASPGIFGFVMAALTAALMSTVDTLINATAAIFINDIYRPLKGLLRRWASARSAVPAGGAIGAVAGPNEDRRELAAARWASIGITTLGVLAVLAFRRFPTVYEAHGYFHSTLTPPLVVAIFLGVFWRRFTPAAVITTFLGGVALMILGARYPALLIAPFDHGIPMNPERPYSYIRALYNLVVCAGVGVLVTITTDLQRRITARWSRVGEGGRGLTVGLSAAAGIAFLAVVLAWGPLALQLGLVLLVVAVVPLVVTHAVPYDEETHTRGLTSWSIDAARRRFKGAELNEAEGEQVEVRWRRAAASAGQDGGGAAEVACFSRAELARMAAAEGDLVYICDRRGWLGGLKSIHATIGPPHDEPGVVMLTQAQIESGVFAPGRPLVADKEM